MEELSNEQLLEIYDSDLEYSYITNDNEIIHTDDYESIPLDSIDYCIFHSDFETMFELRDELVKRGLLAA